MTFRPLHRNAPGAAVSHACDLLILARQTVQLEDGRGGADRLIVAEADLFSY